jgi:hypothetical protein
MTIFALEPMLAAVHRRKETWTKIEGPKPKGVGVAVITLIADPAHAEECVAIAR